MRARTTPATRFGVANSTYRVDQLTTLLALTGSNRPLAAIECSGVDIHSSVWTCHDPDQSSATPASV